MSRSLRRQPHRGLQNGDGRTGRPSPGWQALRVEPAAFFNPRPPAVPATLHLTREEYFAAAALIGLLASQGKEPDQEWAREWAHRMGRKMAGPRRIKR